MPDKPTVGMYGATQPDAIDVALVLALVKARLGITSTVRDEYLTAIIDGIIAELEREKGLSLRPDNPYHLMFVVDFATWRYQSVAEPSQAPGRTPLAMPRHLQFRLHNLLISEGAKDV